MDCANFQTCVELDLKWSDNGWHRRLNHPLLGEVFPAEK